MYCTGTVPGLPVRISLEIAAAFPRYALSLMLKFTQIGFTWETVVIFVVVPTRSPICDLASPAMPSIGE